MNLLLFIDFKHKKHKKCQICAAVNLTSTANSCCAKLTLLLNIPNTGSAEQVRRNFPAEVKKVNPKSILFLPLKLYKVPLLPPILNFIKLHLGFIYLCNDSFFLVKRIYWKHIQLLLFWIFLIDRITELEVWRKAADVIFSAQERLQTFTEH